VRGRKKTPRSPDRGERGGGCEERGERGVSERVEGGERKLARSVLGIGEKRVKRKREELRYRSL
jgi:hypothetical protein